MLTIEVPEIQKLPHLLPRQWDVVAVADHLLTALLRHDSGLLHADFQDGGGRWRVRGWALQSSITEEVVAVIENLGYFRAVLARFGHAYMQGQLYGGFSEGVLTQGRTRRRFALYMANDGFRGYWLRVYITPSS